MAGPKAREQLENEDVRLERAGTTQARTLAEEAADALRDLILLEKIAPGAAIPERDLADALGVSRTPLRQAMRILEIEGLIRYSATRRPRVADPSIDELAQSLAVLGALEALAGREACANATDSETTRVNALNQKMIDTSETADPLQFFRTDMEFHRTLVVAARNVPLLETHARYNARLWRARFISSRSRPDRAGTLEQHSEIAAALTRRDADACAVALGQHLATTVVNIRKTRAQAGDPEEEGSR